MTNPFRRDKSQTTKIIRRISERQLLETRGERRSAALDGIDLPDPGDALYIMGDGRFSSLDLVERWLDGRVADSMRIWTWAVAEPEIRRAHRLARQVRWTIDASLRRRAPATYALLLEAAGRNNVWEGRTHAKIMVVDGPLNVALFSSANLNLCRRQEFWHVTTDPAVIEWLVTK